MTTNKAHAIPNGVPQTQSPSAQFDAAFLEHWPAIYRVLSRLVGDSAEAEDLALETFWQFYQHPPTNNRALNLGGWLYRVAMNLGLNALRARKRRTQHELTAGKWEIENQVNDPTQAVIAEEERVRVRRVLSEMEPRQAQLLTLRYSGMAYAEIAAALDLAPSSIGTLLARAEREFESRYREQGKGE